MDKNLRLQFIHSCRQLDTGADPNFSDLLLKFTKLCGQRLSTWAASSLVRERGALEVGL